jgi:hypothetical protein
MDAYAQVDNEHTRYYLLMINSCFTKKLSSAQIIYSIAAPIFTTSYFVKKFYQSKITFFKTNLRDGSLEMWMNLDGCPGIR